MSSQTRGPGYLPTLDGWRAVAIIAVIVSHARSTLVGQGLGDPQILSIASFGRLGVDLFFAISGFLITYKLLAEERSPAGASLAGFYLRRSFRILPLYYTYLVTISVLAYFAALPVSWQEVTSCAFFVRNYATPPEGGYTNHFWSLSVEEHFYLLWPLLLVTAGSRRARWLVPVLAMLIHCWRGVDSRYHVFARFFPDNGVVWRTDVRLDALLWGCFAALVTVARPGIRFPSWSPWAIIGTLLAALCVAAPGLPLIIALLFPLLILSTVSNPGGVAGRVLEMSALKWIGRLSYGLYVWQTLFLQSSSGPDPDWLRPLKQWPWNFLLIGMCSVVSHYALEKPMIRLGRVLGGGGGSSRAG